MNLFLDTSVLLAACGSDSGASREIFRRASPNNRNLISTPYVLEEVRRNLIHLAMNARIDWSILHTKLSIREDILTLDRPAVFVPGKDRPILFGALAWADILLTLDQGDFGGLMIQPFYGLRVRRPGPFLEEERSASRLRPSTSTIEREG